MTCSSSKKMEIQVFADNRSLVGGDLCYREAKQNFNFNLLQRLDKCQKTNIDVRINFFLMKRVVRVNGNS